MTIDKDMPQASDSSPAPAPPSTGEGPATLQELQARLEEADRERAQFKAIAQRAQADLVNYRQRVEREREDMRRATVERAITKLLPIVDDLQLALKHAPVQLADDSWVEGVRLIERRLQALLESEGVTAIPAEGKPFDPWQHEALFSVNDPSKEPGAVVMVIRQGYMLQDKVLRAAQVAIAQGQSTSAEETDQGQSRNEPPDSPVQRKEQ
ncbi:MAG: nucleotide exchange factor GrpE [Chloroflexi bacterium]|nr:nucleotide exchange factor GrpE [Chloroflexota bacterium]